MFHHKVISDVDLNFKSVSLGKKIDSNFLITYSRNSNFGQSKLFQPDSNNVITFNEIYHTRCKFVFNKKDEKPKPKKIKVVLHRMYEDQTTKIFGKLNFDISELYGSDKTKVDVEMETNRKIKPILKIEFKINEVGKVIQEPEKGEEPEKKVEEVVEKHPGKRRVRKKKVEEEEIWEPAPILPTHGEEEDIVEEDGNETDKFYEIIQMLRGIMAYRFEKCKNPSFLNKEKNITIPPSVFPTYGFFLYSKILSNDIDDDNFNRFINEFTEEFEKAIITENCTNTERFMNTLSLYHLVYTNPTNEDFNKYHTDLFLTKLNDFLNIYAKKLFTTKLNSCNRLIYIFLKGNFEVDSLIKNFVEIFQMISNSYDFTESINKFLFNVFIKTIDSSIANKIIDNQNEYEYKIIILWNSFITAFEQCFDYRLSITKEVIRLLNISYNLGEGNYHDLFEIVCPDLEPRLIVHLLKKIKFDENVMESEIPISSVEHELGIDLNEEYTFTSFQQTEKYEPKTDEVKVTTWNRVTTQDTIREFPYLLDFIPRRRKSFKKQVFT